jgi:undecaprenyl-diphosphatase
MTNIFQALLLGAVQGATEFIPVSSSGHLELLPSIFGWEKLSTDLIQFAHFGTFLALLIYFRNDIKDLIVAALRWLSYQTNKSLKPTKEDRVQWKLITQIILAVIPAAILGVLFESKIEALYDQSPDQRIPAAITIIGMALVGAAFLVVDNLVRNRKRIDLEKLPNSKILVIGLSQALAFIRGVSRSGITIFTGQLVGLNRVDAAKFSFLLSLPIMAGTSLLSIKDLLSLSSENLTAIAPTALAILVSSFVCGLLAIRFLLSYLQKNSLAAFGWYRIAFAALAAAILLR